MIQETVKGITLFKSELLSAFGFLHAFTSRRGGVSCGCFDSLNVSTRRRDKDGECDKYQSTVENFRRVTALVGSSPEKAACAHQVHGNTVIPLDGSFAGMGILKEAKRNVDGDGLFLSPDIEEVTAICVKSADCTPILLADKVTGAVCAVHSGWRGTAKCIVGEAVRVMTENGSRTADILVAVGPCIGSCCYEVGEEVFLECEKALTEKNARHLLEELFINKRESENGVKYHFNIGKMCAELAVLAGVPRENVDFLDRCTCCSSDEEGRIFFSHRGQGGHSGTFASVIAPRCDG